MEKTKDEMSLKFKKIKNEFTNLTNNSFKNPLIKYNSHLILYNRPYLPNNKIKSISCKDLKNVLEQIGKDNLNICDDKLISNIKIESYEDILKKNTLITIKNDKSIKSKRSNRTNSKSVNSKKNNRKKNKIIQKRNIIPIPQSINSLELNCNKIAYMNDLNKKNQNHKKHLKKENTSNKNCFRNINQFINKPNETEKNTSKDVLMTPINPKSKNNKKFHTSQKNNNVFNNKETLSLSSTSRLNISKNYIRGKSMPSMGTNKNKSNFKLPSKSIIKNQDKTIIELQKLFGEKIQLNEESYLNMNDFDKKNCINFLLEIIKELTNINKINKSKSDGYKQLIESKEQMIKNYKNEIKELKKENAKLNKLIKNNNQIYKKLNQNYEQIKLQLEKEKIKNKNKNKDIHIRVKSNSKIKNIYSNKYRNENSSNKNRIYKENKSHDKLKEVNIIKKQKEKSFDKKLNNNLNNNEESKNNIYEKLNVNIVWKNNEENKTDISPNSKISNYSKEQYDTKYNIFSNNLVNV